jgi:uncharacterized protein (DUF2141 family)
MSNARKTTWMFGLSLICAAVTLHAPAARAQADAGSTIRVDVSEFRNTQGTLNCRLFTQPADFPDGEGVANVRATIAGRQARCVFSNLAPGTYAVAVVHDENGNGRLDKNLLGVPSEGYGVSHNRTYALSSPKWEESRFSVTSAEPVVMRVNLRY